MRRKRTGITSLAIGGLCAALASAPAATAKPRPTCASLSAGMRLDVRTLEARIVSKRNKRSGRTYYGCLESKRKLRLLFEDGNFDEFDERVSKPRLAGPYAGIVLDSGGGAVNVQTLLAFDLRTGSRRFRAEAEGAAQRDQQTLRSIVADWALTSSGRAAWIATLSRKIGSSPAVPLPNEVRSYDSRGGLLVDAGFDVDVSSLDVARRSFTWRRGAILKAAALQ